MYVRWSFKYCLRSFTLNAYVQWCVVYGGSQLCPWLIFLSKWKVAKELLPFCYIMLIGMFSLNHFFCSTNLGILVWVGRGNIDEKRISRVLFWGFFLLSGFAVLCFVSNPPSTSKPQNKTQSDKFVHSGHEAWSYFSTEGQQAKRQRIICCLSHSNGRTSNDPTGLEASYYGFLKGEIKGQQSGF